MKEYIVKADFVTENGELIDQKIIEEITRCKDCNWFREGNGECVLWNYEKTNKNAFCFYGSRKQTGADYAGFEVYEAERPE